jgi:tetratricopeptide (TPR) repeat protein
MKRGPQPKEWHEGERAWNSGDREKARALFAQAVQVASDAKGLSPAYFLSQWAYSEATIGDRDGFEDLFRRAFELEPNAPFLKLSYARVLWTEFKDAPSATRAIEDLEQMLKSERWDRSEDLSSLAYEQKIETLRAWVRGEEGGPLWP